MKSLAHPGVVESRPSLRDPERDRGLDALPTTPGLLVNRGKPRLFLPVEKSLQGHPAALTAELLDRQPVQAPALPTHPHVVQNWVEELKARVPTN